MSDASASTVRVAYLPLVDCAPLVVARRLGLDAAHGIHLDLQQQGSWAAVRDRLISGEVEAAHLPASVVHAIDLGIAGPHVPMAWLMTLNQNGQAITLSMPLAEGLRQGATLPQALATLGHRAVLAQTFPTGTHALWLYYWLAAQGVDPMRDVGVVSLPPTRMPAAMAAGQIDGYCSGEPWAALSEAAGTGRRMVRSGEIWAGHPEKVLACRRELAALQPERAERLTACVLAACRWLDDEPDHRAQCAAWLAEDSMIGVPESRLAACLREAPGDPAALAFHRGGTVNLPWRSDGEWILGQFARWGWYTPEANDAQRLRDIHRTETFRRAAARLGIDVPADDRRTSRRFDE